MPFEYCDANGKCCWCHKGEPERQAWDWMVCQNCFNELEEEEYQSYLRRKKQKRATSS